MIWNSKEFLTVEFYVFSASRRRARAHWGGLFFVKPFFLHRRKCFRSWESFHFRVLCVFFLFRWKWIGTQCLASAWHKIWPLLLRATVQMWEYTFGLGLKDEEKIFFLLMLKRIQRKADDIEFDMTVRRYTGTGPWCSPFYGWVPVQEGGPCGEVGLAILGRESLALLLTRGRGSSRLRCRSAGPSIALRRRTPSYRPCGCHWCWFSQAPCDSRLWGERRPWVQRSAAGVWVVPR